MNICVIATASRESGALSIYLQFLNALKGQGGNARYYIFVDECMPQPQIEGVTYIIYDTRGFKRITFDFIGFKKTIKKLHIIPDRIVSFQNTAVRFPRVNQIIYFHNPHPLTSKWWNPVSSRTRSLFFYTWIYPIYIKCLLKKEMTIVVQTEHVKNGFQRKFHHPNKNIHVLFPEIDITYKKDILDTKIMDELKYNFNFIFPATPLIYKRHDKLVKVACEVRKLSPQIFHKLRIHLTINSSEDKQLAFRIKEYDLTNQFVFHGRIEHYKLFTYYMKCDALLFPSDIETLGLPLIEAAACGTPIAVADKPYAHDVLTEYDGAKYMRTVSDWAEFIIDICNNKQKFKPIVSGRDNNSWLRFLQLISYGSKL